MTAPATSHTGTTGRRVTQPVVHHGTGLHDNTLINGRKAEDYELAIRDRVYEQQRAKDAEQLRIAPPQPAIDARDLVALVRSLDPLPWEKP